MCEELSAKVTPASEPHVHINRVYKHYPDITALKDLTLTVHRGEFFSLLGPSGCGKSTTLRLIAGLDCLSAGSITIDNTLVSSPAQSLPPNKRGVGIVFQDYALFPHMTVSENVVFGLHGRPKTFINRRVGELLALVGLESSGKKYPHELSGGQKQRVALARALAPQPKVMLLDEPFSNLDAELRVALRNEAKLILLESGATVILVTHDREEAFSLSDRVGLLNSGRLEQVDTPYNIYHHPTNRFVADFVGLSDYVPIRVDGTRVISALGNFELPRPSEFANTNVDLLIRPDHISITPNALSTTVISDVRFLGAYALYTLQMEDGSTLHSQGLSSLLLPVFTRVDVTINLKHTIVFPRPEL